MGEIDLKANTEIDCRTGRLSHKGKHIAHILQEAHDALKKGLRGGARNEKLRKAMNDLRELELAEEIQMPTGDIRELTHRYLKAGDFLLQESAQKFSKTIW